MNKESISSISDAEKYEKLREIVQNYEEDEKSKKLIVKAYRQVIPRNQLRILGEEIINYQTSKEIMETLLCCYRQDSLILDRFVCFIVLGESEQKNLKLINQLTSWCKYCVNYDKTLTEIKETLDNYQPHLALAISKGADKKNPNKYIAEAWLIENINDKKNDNLVPYWQPLKIKGNLVYYFNKKPTKKEIIVVLQGLIDSFYHKNRSHCLEQIQIFIPYELMNNYPVDNYEILLKTKKRTRIGKLYQVVMRFSERLKEEGDYHCIRRWQNKEEQIKLNICAKDVFNLANKDDIESLENYFQIQDENQNNKIIAIKRTTCFQQQKEEKQFLTLLFNCSIPICLWVRQEIEDLETQIKSFWEKQLKDLPLEVKLRRMETSSKNKTTHIGHHLWLLWDFPHFLPPKHKRSHPQQPLTEINL